MTSITRRPAAQPARALAIAVACTMAITACPAVHAQTAPSPPARTPLPPPPSIENLPPLRPLGELERLATGAGVRTCLDAVRSTGPLLAGPEGAYAAQLMTHPSAADGAFGTAIERAASNATGASLVSAFFMPTAKGGCDVGYDRVDFWSKSCQDVVLQDLDHPYEWASDVIRNRVHVLSLGPRQQVYLMRVPGGCVTIRKELVSR